MGFTEDRSEYVIDSTKCQGRCVRARLPGTDEVLRLKCVKSFNRIALLPMRSRWTTALRGVSLAALGVGAALLTMFAMAKTGKGSGWVSGASGNRGNGGDGGSAAAALSPTFPAPVAGDERPAETFRERQGAGYTTARVA